MPASIGDHIQTIGALYESVICLTVLFHETPRVEPDKRALVEAIGAGITRIVLRFGFIEITDIGAIPRDLQGLGAGVDLDNAIFFGIRGIVAPHSRGRVLLRWRLPIFALVYRNAVKIVDRFHLAASSVVGVGREIEI